MSGFGHVPKIVPEWAAPWVAWRLLGAKRTERPGEAPRSIPGWALWIPAWSAWVAGARHGPRPRAPLEIPRPVWTIHRDALRLVNKARSHPSAHAHDLWRTRAVWINNPASVPLGLVAEYARRYGYALAVLPFSRGNRRVGDDQARASAFATGLFHDEGLRVAGWGWGEAADPVGEAELAATIVREQALDGWVHNGEKPYEGGGLSGAFVEAFRRRQPDAPLGWSPEPQLALDHDVMRSNRVAMMPQAYPGENGWTPAGVIDVAVRVFGWPVEDVMPLLQAYPVGGARPDASEMATECLSRGVPGFTLYPADASLDVPDYWQTLARALP